MNTNTRKNIYEFTFSEKVTHLELHPTALLIKYKNVTHLDPHPTAHMIKFRATFRFELPLPQDLQFNHFDIMDIYYFKYVVRDIKSRTGNNIFKTWGKLLQTELDIIKINAEEAYEKYLSYLHKSSAKLAELLLERDNSWSVDDIEYYEGRINSIDETIQNLRTEWKDYLFIYERETAIKNGTNLYDD